MRTAHLDRLQPVCPACRLAERDPAPLALGTVVQECGDDVIEGVLLCPEPACRREHPIIDGIPVVVADLMGWASHQLGAVFRRDDLSPFMESLLGDAAGPGSDFDRERSNLSGYGRSHWGAGENGEVGGGGGGGIVELTGAALDLLDGEPAGIWIDTGCAVGRATFELAARTGAPAVGVDLSFSMVRTAERVRREGRAVFPERRVGVVYERRDTVVEGLPSDQVSFWCADVSVLPFADGTFDGALSLNVLDCVASPLGHLLELGRTLADGAPALLASPYDWAPTATPMAGWLGGHSQRSHAAGSSAVELRRILGESAPAGVDTGLVVTAEHDGVPWRVHVNERATMDYAVDLLRLERVARRD